MSVTKCKIQIGMTATEQFDATEMPAAPSDAERTLTAGAANLNVTLGPTTTPKVDKPVYNQKLTLGVGTTTINLTSAAGLAGPAAAVRTVDFTGAKLKGFLLRCGTTNNAAGITVAPGASNAYPGLFGASKSVLLGPGSVLARTWTGVESDAVAVSSTVKNIDISGTTGDVIEVELIFGS